MTRVTDCDHALGGSESHQYESLAALTRQAQRNNNRLALQASRSSANAVIDRLSCSCFAVAVGTIFVVTLVSVVTVLISGEEKKLKETEIIVEKIQMNEKPVLVSKSSYLKMADNNGTFKTMSMKASRILDGKNNNSGESEDTVNPKSVNEERVSHRKGGVNLAGKGVEETKKGVVSRKTPASTVVEKKSGAVPANRDDDDDKHAAVAAAAADNVEEDDGDIDDDASPATKELLHEAREMNKPRTVEVGEEANIERKILPLNPNEDR